MGCNTSKESVQPATDAEAENGAVLKQETIAVAVQPKESDDKEETDLTSKEQEEAATRIQAAFRGHHARKSMNDSASSQKSDEPTKEQLEAEFREDDLELCNAASKIQASFRSHMSKREEQATALVNSAKDAMDSAARRIEEKVDDTMNELEGIDLADPDLNKAATKIQASFRGHKVRQEVTQEIKK